MPATLAQLLARPELGLRLLAGGGAGAGGGGGGAGGGLDAPIQWAHSSDLADPTPFLAPGQVLLITEAPDDIEAYVARLVAHGIAAVGFGTEVVRATPETLVEECERQGLPLFEVPYRTPFIAVARFVADRVAADTYARNTWALRASRAISLAALRPDALGSVLGELARQIDRPVALVGADGALGSVFPTGGLGADARDALTAAAEPLLRGRRRAAGTARAGGVSFSLQTLGAAGRLRGVLAVGSDDLDSAAQQVVTGVVALAGLALEQSRATDAARARLRTAVWRALLAGDRALAEAVAEPVVGALPTGAVRVAILSGTAVPAAADWMEAQGEDFFARDGSDLVLVLEGGGAAGGAGGTDVSPASGIVELARRFDLRAGVSAPGSLDALAGAVAQAQSARDRANAEHPVTSFDDVTSSGMLALLETPDARVVAAAALAPLVAADPSLPRILRVWLDRDGVYDVAARELGMHRHTLRARVAEAERLLGRDLGAFSARADLYAALRVAG